LLQCVLLQCVLLLTSGVHIATVGQRYSWSVATVGQSLQLVSISVGQRYSWSVYQLVSTSVGQYISWSVATVGQYISCSVATVAHIATVCDSLGVLLQFGVHVLTLALTLPLKN